jgi:molybdopterin-guanine dinucleotide biosynthesis protein A
MGGRPKHLLTLGGASLLEITHRVLDPHVDDVVLLGSGPRPTPWDRLPCLPDPPSTHGPMAGMLAALRWRPDASWLFVGCDMPGLSADAVTWLLGQRGAGRWAVLPRLSEASVEPLLAVYETQARVLLEDLAVGGCLTPRMIQGHPRVVHPEVPRHLHTAWVNVNTPEDLERLCR